MIDMSNTERFYDIDNDGNPIVWIAFWNEYKYPYEEICLRKDVAEALVKIWKTKNPYVNQDDFKVFPREVTTEKKIIAHYTKPIEDKK